MEVWALKGLWSLLTAEEEEGSWGYGRGDADNAKDVHDRRLTSQNLKH